MTVSFYVCFRLHGYAKEYAKWAITQTHGEAGRLRMRGQKPKPHITMFGPARANNLKVVISELERIGRSYTLVPFKIKGISCFDKPGKVIYLDIDSSQELKRLQHELAESLIWSCNSYTEWDAKLSHKFHVTLGLFNTRDNNRFDELYTYTKNHCGLENFKQHKASFMVKLANIVKKYVLRIEEEKEEQGLNQHLVRITILGRGSIIQCEYDLVLKKLLNPGQALSRYWWRRTISRLQELQSLPKLQ